MSETLNSLPQFYINLMCADRQHCGDCRGSRAWRENRCEFEAPPDGLIDWSCPMGVAWPDGYAPTDAPAPVSPPKPRQSRPRAAHAADPFTAEVAAAKRQEAEAQAWSDAKARIKRHIETIHGVPVQECPTCDEPPQYKPGGLLRKLIEGGWAMAMNRLGIGCSTDEVVDARRSICESCPLELLTPCGKDRSGLCCGQMLTGKGSNPDNPGCGCRLEEKWKRANAQCPHSYW